MASLADMLRDKGIDVATEGLDVADEFDALIRSGPEVNDRIHAYGGIVLHDVINNVFARKAVDKGADGLIAVAAGAGGHAGTQSPFALVQEIRSWYDGPLVLSGSIAHGNSVLAAQAAGADFAYIGSIFIATDEANAEPDYKQMIVDSTVGHHLQQPLHRRARQLPARQHHRRRTRPDALPGSDSAAMNFAGGSAKDAKAWRDVWGAGHGIGNVDVVRPAAALVDRLIAEYGTARARLSAVPVHT
ncbi:NAD(P)H-dependent flavin oxidoreductase [Nocardia sp. NPDC052278]|uniref:NAD(P)H-dependent flavin oxidoreductase n=1 Tax=unclassified Nocardia TaxID=2637762 RepID=UPI00369BE75D